MNDSSNKITFALFLKQAQTWLTFGYLTMVGLGMLFYGQKFQEFDINIFQYATLLYFLIAPFEDLVIFKLSAAIVVIFALSYRMDLYIEERFPRAYSIMYFGANKASWFDRYKAWSWPITFFILIIVYSVYYAEHAYERTLESNDIVVNYANGDRAQGKLIGKTDNVIFLLEDDQVKAIPLEAMANIILGRIAKTALSDSPESLPAAPTKNTVTGAEPEAAENTEASSAGNSLTPSD